MERIKTSLEMKLLMASLGVLEFKDSDWTLPITGSDLEDDYVSESSSPALIGKLSHKIVCRETGKCSHCHPHKGMDNTNNSIVLRNWKQYRKTQWRVATPQYRVTEIDLVEIEED